MLPDMEVLVLETAAILCYSSLSALVARSSLRSLPIMRLGPKTRSSCRACRSCCGFVTPPTSGDCGLARKAETFSPDFKSSHFGAGSRSISSVSIRASRSPCALILSSSALNLLSIELNWAADQPMLPAKSVVSNAA